MNHTILIILAGLVVAEGGASPTPRRLNFSPTLINAPFNPPYGRQMVIHNIKKSSQMMESQQGVSLGIVDQFPSDQRAKDQLLAANTGVAFTQDQRFIDLAVHLFSSPLVTHATFTQWKDRDGRVWKMGHEHPDVVRASIHGKGGPSLSIQFTVEAIPTTDLPAVFSFSKTGVGPLEIESDDLREILEHISGRSLSPSLINHLTTKLVFGMKPEEFHVRLPSESEGPLHFQQTEFEYLNHEWAKVREEFNPEKKQFVRWWSKILGIEKVEVVDSLGNSVNFSYHLQLPRHFKGLGFWVRKNGTLRPALTAKRVTELVFGITKIVIPNPRAAHIAKRLQNQTVQDHFQVDVGIDLDLKIWKVISERPLSGGII